VQAQEYIARTSSKEEKTSSKKKRARDDEGDADIDQTSAEIAAAEAQASKWMETDEYAMEIAHRIEELAPRFARYEPMHALTRKQLKGKALTTKLQEIKDKLDNLEEIHQGLIKLNEKQHAELFQDVLKRISDERTNSKKRRIESEPSEPEDLAISDGK
jgi:predicted nuclease with TOPRIM domain